MCCSAPQQLGPLLFIASGRDGFSFFRDSAMCRRVVPIRNRNHLVPRPHGKTISYALMRTGNEEARGDPSVIYAPDLISRQSRFYAGLKVQFDRAGKRDAPVSDSRSDQSQMFPSKSAEELSRAHLKNPSITGDRGGEANRNFRGSADRPIAEIQNKYSVFRRQRKETESKEREDSEMGAGEEGRASGEERDGERARERGRGQKKERGREKASKCWSKRVGCWLHS